MAAETPLPPLSVDPASPFHAATQMADGEALSSAEAIYARDGERHGGSLAGRLREALAVVRFRPFPLDTPEGRARERLRRVALTFATSLIARVVATGTLFLTTRLTLRYLGQERFGMWMAIVSAALTFLVFADLGLGNGLLNLLTDSHGRDDQSGIVTAVSSGFAMLTAIAVAVGLIFVGVYPFVSWARVFRVVSPVASAEAGPAIAVFVVCFLINLPLGVVARIQNGFQEGYVTNLWAIAGSVASLAGVLLVLRAEAGLPWLVAAASGGAVIASTLNSLHQYFIVRRSLRPRLALARRPVANRIFRLGVLFFILQITSAVVLQSDNLIATRLFGPASVTQYAVPLQMFAVIPVLVLMMILPLWPAYGEALARGDVSWVLATLRSSLLLCIATSAVIAVPLVIFGRSIVHYWVGPSVDPSRLLLIGMAVSAVLLSAGAAIGVFLNGVNWVRFQVIVAVIVAGPAIALKIVLARWMGVSGIIWGTVIGFGIPSALAYAFLLPRKLRQMRLASVGVPHDEAHLRR